MVFNLAALAYEVVNTQIIQAEKKGLWLYCEKMPSLPNQVRADADKLRQILFNLLDNAIQYTQTGGVTLHVTQIGPEIQGVIGPDMAGYLPSTVRLAFKVEDTGPGMDMDRIKQITVPHSRKKIEALIKSGAGVGIPIAVKLTELMGGKLSITSNPGKGTAVVVELEMEVADTEAPQLPLPEATEPVQALRPKPFSLSKDPIAAMAILFFASALLFAWPFLAAPNERHPHGIFIFLFSAWAVVITLIYLLNRSHSSARFSKEEKNRDT